MTWAAISVARSSPGHCSYTSSTTVEFCGGAYTLTFDGNSKISAHTRNPPSVYGTWSAPLPNSLSLPAITCCPGSTPACRAECYVVAPDGLEARDPLLAAAYQANAATLGQAMFAPGRAITLAREVGTWITSNCPNGFRWHVSGDVMHVRHAQWIATVVRHSLHTRHWIYTRTFDPACLSALADAATINPYFAINLSADSDNYTAALEALYSPATSGPDGRSLARIAYMTSGYVPPNLPHGSVVFPTDAVRKNPAWLAAQSPNTRHGICPADMFGQSESYRCGPCTKCIKPVPPPRKY